MVNIKIFRDQTGLISAYSMTGHANTAEYGQDIVCAGISALAQTAVLGLEKHLQHNLKVEIDSGKLHVTLLESPNSLTEAILATMLIGLTDLSEQNPKSVRISEHRR